MSGASAKREDAALAALLSRAERVPRGRVESYGPHPDQVIEWYAATTSGERAPVVVVHGGFFRPTIDRTHARPMAAALAERLNAPVVLMEYRRVPGQPEAAVADVDAVSDLMEALSEEPAVWVGHSAGGALVLQRAFDQVRPAVPTVALAPVADLRSAVAQRLGEGAVVEWLGDRTAAKPSRYARLDPVRLASDLPERWDRVVCVHGSDDGVVPVEQSEAVGVPVRQVLGAHHYDVIDPESAAWSEVVAAIEGVTAQP
ncbi:alpha/beta fold hydrolase [Nostocoides sp. F2B08]|uniref:alpha/beta hydrolase n=1 Tax=Nostocoides sp. F2B08 TaxID=2653936 RepID=UPI0012635FF3|nr:alpha/beta fold hydrolase [Tetrasphaera sp. F2B08]KAB7743823.1 alpha/beta fold hydrolase [Tetrasphaera sp. F2B08]